VLGFQSGAKSKRVDVASVEARTHERLMGGARRLFGSGDAVLTDAERAALAMPMALAGGGARAAAPWGAAADRHGDAGAHACPARAHGGGAGAGSMGAWDELAGLGHEEAAACSHCSKDLCEMCWRSCSGCQDVFCDGCSILNYDDSVDRTFCLDCNDEYCRERVRSPVAHARARAPQA